MKTISIPFRGAIRQNYRKTEDKHPDFTGIVTIWHELYDAAAWLAENSKGRPYVALRLTIARDSHEEKIKVPIWEHRGRTKDSDPHFSSIADIAEQKFKVQAWILPDDDHHGHQLVIEIELLEISRDALSDAGSRTQEKLEAFVRSTRLSPQLDDTSKSGSVMGLPPPESLKAVPDTDANGDPDTPF
jgi:hypothetical protein